MNDPNGLVYYAGEYHMFFQHNPFGTEWGNMTWGHAVSKDLVHWKQLPNALEPDGLGTMFSGSAVVDWNNTAGFQTGKEKTLVAIYTAAGDTSDQSKGQPFTQCIAYSNDRGRTWSKYAANPVLKNVVKGNRDPKVVWHAPTKRWIMALFLDGNEYALFRSPNLKSWEMLQKITMPDCGECPDFFEIPVKGDKIKKWVLTAANGKYLIGDFDGTKFTPEPGGPLQLEFGANCYAVQTYSDIPPKDGRRIQIGWMNGGKYPGMPFNQQMTIPCELTLQRTSEGLRLLKLPVSEIGVLHSSRGEGAGHTISDEHKSTFKCAEPVELHVEITVNDAREVIVTVHGEPITYNVAEQKLTALGKSAPLPLRRGTLFLDVLADRTSLEVFGGKGQIALSSCCLPRREDYGAVEVSAKGGTATLVRLLVNGLNSAWK
jgi:sucrose-6-phosphate hydrolase SacC (GH32 family)